MSRGNGTTTAPVGVIADRGRVVLPGRRFGPRDALLSLAAVALGVVFAVITDAWVAGVAWFAVAVSGLVDTAFARVVVTDDAVVDDEWRARTTIPLAAVRWARADGASVTLGLEGPPMYGDDAPTTSVVRLGPWSRRATDGYPEAYAVAVAAALSARANRLAPVRAETPRRRTTRAGWLVPAVLVLVLVVLGVVTLL